MKNTIKLSISRRGSALPIIIMIVVLLIIIGYGIIDMGTQSRLFAVRSAADITARTAADDAVADAVHRMNIKLKSKPWSDAVLPAATDLEMLNNKDATYDFQVSKVDSNYTVQGIGRNGLTTHMINGTLELRSIFEYAVLARDSIQFKAKSKVDWYNNKPGDGPLEVGVISTQNNAITLMNGSYINGDVLVGANGNPDTIINGKNGVTIAGDAYPMVFNPPLPSYNPPDTLALAASKGNLTNTATLTSASSGKYNSINLGNGELVTISQPVTIYVTGDIKFGNSAGIKIDPNASLTIYLAGNLDALHGTGFNNLATKDSTKLSIYCMDSCTSVRWKNSTDFIGTVYAPNAFVDLDNGTDVYGSIVAGSFLMRNSGILHYDANLRRRNINDEGVMFVINRWSEQ